MKFASPESFWKVLKFWKDINKYFDGEQSPWRWKCAQNSYSKTVSNPCMESFPKKLSTVQKQDRYKGSTFLKSRLSYFYLKSTHSLLQQKNLNRTGLRLIELPRYFSST